MPAHITPVLPPPFACPHHPYPAMTPPPPQTTAFLGDLIGAITLTGSAIAFGKLNGNLDSAPLALPGR